MAGTTPMHSARILYSCCAGAIRSAQGPCDLLVVFSASLDSVLLPLKFSFEKLQNATLKSCFLYCCLFPDGYNIDIEELIEYWRAERFLDGYDRYGEYIIRSLKRACLRIKRVC